MTVGTSEVYHLDEYSFIQVRVGGVSALKEIIGKDMLVTLKSGSTLGELIDRLEEQFGSTYRATVGERLEDSLRKRFNLLYNGQFITPEQNLHKHLNDGDEILFFQLAGA
jgi:molybdopterin converting factor small subunit